MSKLLTIALFSVLLVGITYADTWWVTHGYCTSNGVPVIGANVVAKYKGQAAIGFSDKPDGYYYTMMTGPCEAWSDTTWATKGGGLEDGDRYTANSPNDYPVHIDFDMHMCEPKK